MSPTEKSLTDDGSKKGLHVDLKPPYGNLLVEVFEELPESQLVQPTLITGYPLEISPLAIGGRELANAVSELNDPADQRQRFMEQLDACKGEDESANPIDEDYVRALEYGMPPAAGEGIGVDRLVIFFTDSPSIRYVILFALLRPQR